MSCCCFFDCCCCDCILAIIAFFIPPFPVIVKRGLCSCDLLINICLCLLGYVPGLIHAWYIILRNPDRYDNYQDIESQQIFVQSPPGSPAVYVTQGADQTRIRFSHPEPFRESHESHHAAPQRPLSPLSSSPITSAPVAQLEPHLNNNNNRTHALSPLASPPVTASNFDSYGSTDDDLAPDEAPPSYDNVMNETSKQFR
ncbi:hypothetical protein CANARDRAFT_10413 [[Candida] arabinofermentans NRRL YB-2248]|uniref:Stress response RCI peptide n=1 Tax=[Candida] arabinofermentans NRRL YB-2248 TaxID=983967 RepID=A0A1E4ST69_9ASCO|nr:hypothetical protein CANARDRAFT_10413 [[Candida] arabinofermentans NRRL YB-2248]